MNTFFTAGNGGASITPSARKSIHCHGTHCPFWNREAMGRYGLRSDEQEHRACASHEQGTDEVDNVMSKLACSSSPVAVRRNETYRRNSLNSPKHTLMEDSDEDSNILSKSSPAMLSSYSYCSYESKSSPVLNSKDNSVSSANNSYSQQRRLNDSSSNISHSSMHSDRRFKEQSTIQEDNTKSINNIQLLLVPIVVIVGILVVFYSDLFKANIETSNIVIYDKLSFYNDVKYVGEKYKISDNSILQVRSGIAEIFKRQDTGSFIFAYDSNVDHFDPVTFNNFMNELASTAAKYLRNHTKTVYHVVVDSSHLQVMTDKELMNKYLEDVDKTGVMLVKELDKIPSSLAMAFHYFCDEYNPLVKRSAIFFTLNMAKCPNVTGQKNTHEKIEKCLADKWDKMPQDNIRPLLTRVVNVVIDVTSDF